VRIAPELQRGPSSTRPETISRRPARAGGNLTRKTTKTTNMNESMFQTNPKQLASYLTAGLGAGCLAVTADAAIVTFSDSGSFIEGTVDDGDQTTSSLTLPDGSSLSIDSGTSRFFLDLALSSTGRFTGPGGVFGNGDYEYPIISLLGLGDPIFAHTSSSTYSATAMLVYNSLPQADFTGDVSGYLGFVTEFGNKGWLKVAFNSVTGRFSFDGGAVATAGEELTAGQIAAIPEPASVLGTIGLLSGGMFVRRRRLAA